MTTMPKSADEAFVCYAGDRGGYMEARLSERAMTSLGDELGIVADTMRRLRDIRCVNRRGRRLLLSSGVTQELHANAFADKSGRYHVMGLTFGQFLTAVYLSVEMFSKSDVFRGLGGAVGNSKDSVDLAPDAAFWEARGRAFFAEVAELDAMDEERRSAARYLRYTMTMFVAYHEYAHVIGGHCAAAGALGLGTRRSETGSESLPDERARVSRSLEYEADATAIQLLMSLIAQGAGPYEEGADFKLGLKDRTRLALVGTALLTSGWHVWHARTGAPVISHPSPDLRFLALQSAAMEKMDECGEGDAFAAARDAAYQDLARASARCPDLAIAIRTFANRAKSGSDWRSEKDVSEDVVRELELEAFAFMDH